MKKFKKEETDAVIPASSEDDIVRPASSADDTETMASSATMVVCEIENEKVASVTFDRVTEETVAALVNDECTEIVLADTGVSSVDDEDIKTTIGVQPETILTDSITLTLDDSTKN